MTPPIAYKTVQGTYLGPDGSAIAGQIRFVPSVTVHDVTGNIVVAPVPLVETLGASGEFEIALCCTDDPESTPNDWTWQVTELFAGGREYEFQLPTSSPALVNLADLAPVESVEATYAYSPAATVAALTERVTSLEESDVAVVAAVVVHPFLLMGA